LIWPGNKALLWAEGNELGCFSSTLLDFLLRARSACASRAIGALLSSYFSSLDGSVRMDFAVLSQQKKKRAVSHRDVDSFYAPNEMGN